jgi:hypothetical protein
VSAGVCVKCGRDVQARTRDGWCGGCVTRDPERSKRIVRLPRYDREYDAADVAVLRDWIADLPANRRPPGKPRGSGKLGPTATFAQRLADRIEEVWLDGEEEVTQAAIAQRWEVNERSLSDKLREAGIDWRDFRERTLRDLWQRHKV